MGCSENKFDPEILQARWVLGGLNAEELVDQTVIALQQGFDGTALQQLAGLVRPTQRDLGNLPVRAFAEMGLEAIDKDQAVSLLISRGEPETCGTITTLLEAFPGFEGRWREHVQKCGGKPAGCYIDMAIFVEFVMEDLYEKKNLSEVHRAFKLLDKLYIEGDKETRNLLALGFFETLQCAASRRHYGDRVFERFLPRTIKKVWKEL